METVHRGMYADAGLPDEVVPPLKPTLGSRVADITVRYFAHSHADEQEPSGTDEPVTPFTLGKFKRLLAKGSAGYFEQSRTSEFGAQTAQTHGGLNYSRSPTVLFHEAPGHFRDIDLSGCYANVMASMRLYAGRPVVFEPGVWDDGKQSPPEQMTLAEAVAFAREHAAGDDAWFVKASGPITAFPNALVPSTKDALTNENYKRRAARRRADPPARPRSGLAFDRPGDGKKGAGNTAIYTDVIEAGIVAHPTWLLIQALPFAWRAEYERLVVDSLVFYPKRLVADSVSDYRGLQAERTFSGTPWTATLDLDRLEMTVRRRLDDDYVSLRCDLGRLARMFQEQRERAQREAGKGSAEEKGWKEQVNSLYGVVASPLLPTNNVVAANVITATARALAFAMHLSLTGLQVITDGCNYRRDEIPAGTLAECLTAHPEYPINRTGFAGPFLDPSAVPAGDAEFTAWYRGHVKRFLGVAGVEYDALFSRHSLAHKEWEQGEEKDTSFDALCCDGSANYVKLLRDGEGWRVVDFKARSFPAGAKDVLQPWGVRTYATDRYDGPPPVLESRTLLKYQPAGDAARTALRRLAAPGERPRVYYPLGLARRTVHTYKVLKSSGFLFRTPEQRRAWVRALGKFSDATGCGLEAIALRDSSGARRRGSLADVAGWVYRLIRKGAKNPAKSLNLNRVPTGVHRLVDEVKARKDTATADLIAVIDERSLDDAAKLTGLFVGPDDILRVV